MQFLDFCIGFNPRGVMTGRGPTQVHVFIRNWFIRNEYEAGQKIKKLCYFVQGKLRNCPISICLKKGKLTSFHSLICAIFVWKRLACDFHLLGNFS